MTGLSSVNTAGNALISIIYETISNTYAYDQGGYMYVAGNNLNVSISGSSFSNVSALN